MEELDIQSMIRMTLKFWLDLQHFCRLVGSIFWYCEMVDKKTGSEMNEEEMTN